MNTFKVTLQETRWENYVLTKTGQKGCFWQHRDMLLGNILIFIIFNISSKVAFKDIHVYYYNHARQVMLN